MTRRIGPVLLVVAGVAGLLAQHVGVDVYPAPVLGVLLALVVAVDATRRRPVGSVIVAGLTAALLLGAFGAVAPGAITAGALLAAGVALLVFDEDAGGWRAIAALAPRTVRLQSAPSRIEVTAVLTRLTVELGAPHGTVELRAVCWGGTVELVVPGDCDVVIGDLHGRGVRFGGECDGLWDGQRRAAPTVVLRTAGSAGSVFVRRTATVLEAC